MVLWRKGFSPKINARVDGHAGERALFQFDVLSSGVVEDSFVERAGLGKRIHTQFALEDGHAALVLL